MRPTLFAAIATIGLLSTQAAVSLDAGVGGGVGGASAGAGVGDGGVGASAGASAGGASAGGSASAGSGGVGGSAGASAGGASAGGSAGAGSGGVGGSAGASAGGASAGGSASAGSGGVGSAGASAGGPVRAAVRVLDRAVSAAAQARAAPRGQRRQEGQASAKPRRARQVQSPQERSQRHPFPGSPPEGFPSGCPLRWRRKRRIRPAHDACSSINRGSARCGPRRPTSSACSSPWWQGPARRPTPWWPAATRSSEPPCRTALSASTRRAPARPGGCATAASRRRSRCG